MDLGCGQQIRRKALILFGKFEIFRLDRLLRSLLRILDRGTGSASLGTGRKKQAGLQRLEMKAAGKRAHGCLGARQPFRRMLWKCLISFQHAGKHLSGHFFEPVCHDIRLEIAKNMTLFKQIKCQSKDKNKI